MFDVFQVLRLDDGQEVVYQQICLCTGGKPKVPSLSNFVLFFLLSDAKLFLTHVYL